MKKTTTQIRISSKNLGQLALQNYCPRCFYLKLRLNFKMPYMIFPGIFSSIDSFSKKLTWAYWDKYKKLPPWFNQFGQSENAVPISAPHHTQFYFIDEETNIKLTGAVDEIIQLKNKSYFIIDYKTAKYTENQDALLPLYVVQLNAYALIAQNIGLSPVSGIGLIYYEPITDITEESLEEVLLENGFSMPFSAHCLQLELEPEGIVKPLLRQVRELWEFEEAPEGNSDCRDCQLLEGLVGMVEETT